MKEQLKAIIQKYTGEKNYMVYNEGLDSGSYDFSSYQASKTLERFASELIDAIPAALQGEDSTPLTEGILIEYGFEKWEGEDEDDVRWHNGFDLHTGNNDTSFNFATNTREDGSFKSGYVVSTLGQLKDIYKALTQKDLIPSPPKQ